MIAILLEYKDMFIEGFKYTISSSLLALAIGITLGVIASLLQSTTNKLLQAIGHAYVEFFRNIPLSVIVLFCYVVLPLVGVKLDGFFSATIGLAVYSSAFIADIIRTGIQAVPKGQMEAARSTGLNYLQAMQYIILPQAIRIVVPGLGNRFVSLIKDSSILAMVAGLDLMYQADIVAQTTFQTFNVYIIVAVCYLVLTLPTSYCMKYIEKKWDSPKQ